MLGELDVTINNVGHVAEGHERFFFIGKILGSHDVGSLLPICTTVGEHEASDSSGGSSAAVQVRDTRLVFAILPCLRTGSLSSGRSRAAHSEIILFIIESTYYDAAK